MPDPPARRRPLVDVGVYAAIALISILHYVAPVHAYQLHDIYRRLYYLPIILASFSHGLAGGAIAAAVVCLAYIPHAFGHISHDPASDTQKILEMVLYFAVGITTGSLVSRRKRTQRQLETSLQQLRSAEDQLVSSAKLAAVGQLSAGLAHEIRNPLASIKGSAEILADDFPAGHPKRRLLDVLIEESVRLNDVLSRFLAFARPRPIERRTIEIDGEIAAVVDLLEGQKEGRAVRFELPAPAGPAVRVRGDRDQIRQVLLNVLLNACQAVGDAGRIRIDRFTDGSRCRIVIRDSGPGFSREAVQNAFTPFFTTKERGIGLGLAVSHRIIELHGGRIRIGNDEDGGGGRVEIELPG